MIFIQRDGTTGTVTYTGDSARVLDSHGAVVADWTTGGSISGIAQGDGYTLGVRTGTTTRTEGLAIGAVVVTMGQSNVSRWFESQTPVAPGSGVYDMSWSGTIGSLNGSGAEHFASQYAALVAVPVLMIEAGRGGTALSPEADKGNGYWLDTTAGSLYATTQSLVERVGGSAELVIWSQGETDASAPVTRERHTTDLTTFMQRVLVDFAPAKVLIQEIGPRGSDDGKYDAVRDAQRDVAAAIGDVIIGAVTEDLNTVEDGVHLSGASRVLTADRVLITAAALNGIDLSRAVQTGSDDPLAGDVMTGGDGRDEILAGSGDDTVEAGGGSDAVFGGAGADVIAGGTDRDFLRGEAGDDQVFGEEGDDVLSGGFGNDLLTGGAGDDEIWADEGNDTLDGGLGNDTLVGGLGTDVALYAGAKADYIITSSGGVIKVTARNPASGVDTLTQVEYAQFSDQLVDLLATAPMPLFTSGIDFVDFATVRAGTYDAASAYLALAGDDEIYLPKTAAVAATSGFTIGAKFDAGTGDDVVIGGGLNDYILGNDGNDVLNGGAGIDRLEGGMGNDTYYVDNISDLIVEKDGGGSDNVYSSVKLTLKSFIEGLVLTGTAANSGTGNDIANVLHGNNAANTLNALAGDDKLFGHDGNDTLNGGVGKDRMEGGTGDDRYIVDSIYDVIVEAANAGYDKVETTVTFTLATNVERLLLLGTEAINGTGNALANRIDGNAGANRIDGGDSDDLLNGLAGNDTIIGGSGNDTIEGGTGFDTLSGGSGNDKFVFRTDADIGGGDTGLASDVVMDFEKGDRVDISKIAPNVLDAAITKFVFIGTSAFSAAGQVHYAQDATTTTIEGEIDGDGLADFALVLMGVFTLVAGDIVL